MKEEQEVLFHKIRQEIYGSYFSSLEQTRYLISMGQCRTIKDLQCLLTEIERELKIRTEFWKQVQ